MNKVPFLTSTFLAILKAIWIVLAVLSLSVPGTRAAAQVTFTQPDGTDVTVDAFYDGGTVFKARAYCGQTGDWTWHCSSRDISQKDKHGTFKVIDPLRRGYRGT